MSGAIRRVMVRGRVQGVGYRAWVKHQARAPRSRWMGAQPSRRLRRGAVCGAAGCRLRNDCLVRARAALFAGRSRRRPALPFRCAESEAGGRGVFAAADDLARRRNSSRRIRGSRDRSPAAVRIERMATMVGPGTLAPSLHCWFGQSLEERMKKIAIALAAAAGGALAIPAANADDARIGVGVGPVGAGVTVGESRDHDRDRTTIIKREDEPRDRTTSSRRSMRIPRTGSS